MLLAQLIAEKKVACVAMIHTKFAGDIGFAQFADEMKALGIDPDTLVEGFHYVINPSEATRHYRLNIQNDGTIKEREKGYGAYSAEVYIKGPVTPELVKELALMLAERDSHPILNKNGDLHTWNNPVFREAVRLGAWRDENAISTRGFAAFDRAIPTDWITDVIDEAKVTLKRIELQQARAEAFKARTKANIMKRTVFKEHAREDSKAATKLEARARELDFDLAEMVRVQEEKTAATKAIA